VAVVALGKCGSREMSAGSDLDLMTLYRAADSAAMSSIKEWSADVFYSRFTQRLIAALSTPTGEGGLYDVDMRLRPTGTKGPVAVSYAAFQEYYAGEAETWEHMALTRARVVWASDPLFATDATSTIDAALRQVRDVARTRRDVCEMRQLMERERPPKGFWDLKMAPGGLVDIEFVAQFLQLVHANSGGPLRQSTVDALRAMADAGLAPTTDLAALVKAYQLQQNLTQLLKVALEDASDPTTEPKAFRALLARAGGARDTRALRARLEASRAAARRAYENLVVA
jgi:glutamate-ammonia-ligase adenylyltransferase